MDATSGQATDWDPKVNLTGSTLAFYDSTLYIGCSIFKKGKLLVNSLAVFASGTKTLNLTARLEGLCDNGPMMRKAQNALGNQYPGTIADHMDVKLYNGTSPYNYIHTLAGQNLHTDGSLQCQIPKSLSGSYFLALKNRNHLETWSATPISFANDTTSYNFADAANKAYGNNLKQIGSTWAIYAGDVNQDGAVDGLDMIPVDNQAANSGTGYIPEDINGDGSIDALDMIVLDNNAAVSTSAILP